MRMADSYYYFYHQYYPPAECLQCGHIVETIRDMRDHYFGHRNPKVSLFWAGLSLEDKYRMVNEEDERRHYLESTRMLDI